MTNEQWFKEFDTHLMDDDAPSVYFNRLIEQKAFPQQHPFVWIARLANVPQSPKFHPEGNVWNHTMIVVDNAAKNKQKSKNARVLMWAALLHDLGKIPATKLRKGRITAYDHDKEGRKMAKEFLTECGCDASFIHKVAVLVRWHMQALFVIRDLPFANLERMTAEVDIGEIGLLALSDRLGRGNTSDEEVLAEQKNILLFMQKSQAYIDRKRHNTIPK